MIQDRIRCSGLAQRIMSAQAAALLIQDGMTVGVSGFTPSGCPKAVPEALAQQGRNVHITLLSGASTGDEIDTLLGNAGVIARRAPYITCESLRKSINSGQVAYQDVHLGEMAQQARYGQYGKIHIALVEACAITEEGGIVPTTAVGCAQTYVALADRVIVELNLTQPAGLEGFHDIYRVQDPPYRKPIPLTQVGERIGVPYIPCDPEKIAAIVISQCPEKPRSLAKPDECSQKIADHIVSFLQAEHQAGRLSAQDVPLQSGVGSVANAVLSGLKASNFTHLRFYSEVMQDAMVDLIDCKKADFCSATSMCLSQQGMAALLANLDGYRDKIVLRDSEISNSPEVIRRLGVIAMNTAIEVDLYGNVNSSHMGGTRIYNGIGGSGDYARSASLSIFMTSSVAKGGRVSSIVPMVSHVDHPEHDVDVIVTEQGIADLRGKSPRERAALIIQHCAHPMYRPQLQAYFEAACAHCGMAQTPQLLHSAFSLHTQLEETGTMLEQTERMLA